MKLCTENDTEVIRSALISLKLPIKRTVIKIPTKMSGLKKSDFSTRTEGGVV